jgi:hypothetical protein
MKTVLLSALLFFANVFVCGKLFFTEYVNWWGSTDGPFIAISRYAMEHRGDLSWFPLWFCGMPYRGVYAPLFPHLAAVAALVARSSAASAFHFLAALFYCLGPVTLFWMVRRLSNSTTQGFLAGLLYSSVSPAAIMLPVIRADVRGWFNLTRLYNVVIYGETPHVAALTLIPLTVIALDAALRSRKPWHYALAALSLAAVVLTSVTGAIGLAMIALAYLISRRQDVRGSLLRAGLIAVVAYGIVGPWFPPSTVRLIALNSQWSLGNHFPFSAWHVLYAAILFGSMLGLNLLLNRLGTAESVRFAVLVLLFSGAVVLLAYFWPSIAVLPQPLRFRLEMEMACCLAVAAAVVRIPRKAPRIVTIALLCLVSVAELAHNRQRANEIIQAADLKNRVEYKEAQWFEQNMRGRRVFAPGSVALWMNVFNDVPQLGGCCDQSVPNWEQRVALYTIYSGQNAGDRDGEICLLWLKAYGVHAAGVSGPGSREYFLAFNNPRKFDGLLPVLWRDGADVIYGVPQRSDSLAHVILPSQMISRKPVHGLDVEPLRPYVAALDDSGLPAAEMQWINNRSASITATLRPGDLVSVQESFDEGWRARVNGVDRKIKEDALGMMVIDPQCVGACSIEMRFEDTGEMRIAKIAMILCVSACLVGLIMSLRRRP